VDTLVHIKEKIHTINLIKKKCLKIFYFITRLYSYSLFNIYDKELHFT
jgi:hypothetical protein